MWSKGANLHGKNEVGADSIRQAGRVARAFCVRGAVGDVGTLSAYVSRSNDVSTFR